MALVLADFLIAYPEFGNAPEVLVQAKLDQAENSVDAAAMGSRFVDAAFAYAAHLLAVSPGGIAARISANGTSTYEMLFDRICREVFAGPSVAGL